MTKLSDASGFRIGGTAVDKIYVGSSLVFDLAGGGGGGGGNDPQEVAFWGEVATDPYWDSVSLLLNFDGTDGSTTFIDSGPQNLTADITRSGAPTISTAQSKFGGASGFFPYASSQSAPALFPPNSPLFDPGSGRFTAECWVRYVTARGRPAAPFRNPMYSPYTAGGYLEVRGGLGGASNVGSLTVDQWSFVAICRDGAEMRLYIDGTLSHAANIGTSAVFKLDMIGAGSLAQSITDGRDSFGGYLDDFRYTKGVCRYSGSTAPVPTSALAAPAVGEILLGLDLASEATAYQGATTLAIAASAYQASVSAYQWQKRASGSQSWQNISGQTTNSLSLTGLTDAENTGDSYRCLVTGPLGMVRSTETTLTVDESGINGDNRFRVTAPASTTSLTAAVESTTGYWKMVSSTGQDSGVIGSQWSQWSPYYFLTGTVSGLPGNAEKTLEVFSCDASGNPSGELEYVSFAPSSQSITRVDASGCASLRGFRVSSSTAPSGSWSGSSSLPATLESVRAVGVAGSGGFYSQWGAYPANVSEGINVEGQLLGAAALNQLYADLSNGTNDARIFVGGNPGTASDDPTIATAKGYTVFGS